MLQANAGLRRLCGPFISNPHRRRSLPAATRARERSQSYTSTSTWKQDNPSFDEIELNEEYYRSLGISPEELADQLSFRASDTDPEGQDIGLEGPVDGENPSFLHDQDLDTEPWGPEVHRNLFAPCCVLTQPVDRTQRSDLFQRAQRLLSTKPLEQALKQMYCRLWFLLDLRLRSAPSYAAR